MVSTQVREKEMNIESIETFAANLENIKLIDSEAGTQVEYWFARDIMQHLGYVDWRNFSKAITRAQQACENSGNEIECHFQATTRQAPLGSGALRPIEDMKLTRYACYLIVQNGDPRKEEVALMQSYFALRTRQAELIEQRMSELIRLAGRKSLTAEESRLSKNIFERGVDGQGFGRIRSRGDAALFGRATAEMKRRLDLPNNRPLADKLHPINVTAKQLATQMTNWTVESKDLHGEFAISNEHVDNNKSIRASLQARGITPEELPAAEDIKKVQRRADRDQRMIERNGFTSLPETED